MKSVIVVIAIIAYIRFWMFLYKVTFGHTPEEVIMPNPSNFYDQKKIRIRSEEQVRKEREEKVSEFWKKMESPDDFF